MDVTESYAQQFPHERVSYKLVFQNRVSTKGLTIISSDETGDGEYWVQPDDSLIRPYGVCIKVVSGQSSRAAVPRPTSATPRPSTAAGAAQWKCLIL